jgi:hypothetical protein
VGSKDIESGKNSGARRFSSNGKPTCERHYEVSDNTTEGTDSSRRRLAASGPDRQPLSAAAAPGLAGAAATEGIILRNGLMLKKRKRQGSQR